MMTFEEALAHLRWTFAGDVRSRRRMVAPSGSGWDQVTPAEQAVFAIAPDDVPELVTLHVYCLAFHAPDPDEWMFRGYTLPAVANGPAFETVRRTLQERLPLDRGSVALETFLEFSTLLGVRRRLAHAWYHKDFYWQLRNEFLAVPEPGLPQRASSEADRERDDEIPF